MNKRERRRWALLMASALLQSDVDTLDTEGEDENEDDCRREAIREIARQLAAKARRIVSAESPRQNKRPKPALTKD